MKDSTASRVPYLSSRTSSRPQWRCKRRRRRAPPRVTGDGGGGGGEGARANPFRTPATHEDGKGGACTLDGGCARANPFRRTRGPAGSAIATSTLKRRPRHRNGIVDAAAAPAGRARFRGGAATSQRDDDDDEAARATLSAPRRRRQSRPSPWGDMIKSVFSHDDEAARARCSRRVGDGRAGRLPAAAKETAGQSASLAAATAATAAVIVALRALVRSWP